jgi:TolB-like protein/Tfp pilus assembly protein PilF
MVAALLVVAGVALTLLTGEGVEPAATQDTPLVTEDDSRPSIAVLPFQNRSGREDDLYFTDGLHDQIITQLTKIRGLSVRGLTSVVVYRDSPKNLREIGEELNARYIMEGGVQRAGQSVRINVQLIEAATDDHIWASVYDRALSVDNLFSIQTEIVEAVTESLRAVVTPEEMARIEALPTASTTAFDEYLVGVAWLTQRTEEAVRRALHHFETAARMDSLFALAYVGMADSYSMMAQYEHMPAKEAFPIAKDLAERALGIDSTLGEAHASLAYVRSRFDWDFEAALESFQKAIELSPNHAIAYQWYSGTLRNLGRVEEAIPLGQTALGLDPLNLNIRRTVASLYRGAGEYDRAARMLEQVLAMDPDHFWARSSLAITLILDGRYGEGLGHQEVLAREQAEDPFFPLAFSWGLGLSGQEARAREVLETVLQERPPDSVDPVDVAMAFAGLGETDAAFQWLDRGFEVRSVDLIQVVANPMWDPLRTDPRHRALLERMGIPTTEVP